jgi:hypothetical protein
MAPITTTNMFAALDSKADGKGGKKASESQSGKTNGNGGKAPESQAGKTDGKGNNKAPVTPPRTRAQTTTTPVKSTPSVKTNTPESASKKKNSPRNRRGTTPPKPDNRIFQINQSLKNLDASERIQIVHHDTKSDKVTVLFTSFPLNLARIFCTNVSVQLYNNTPAILLTGLQAEAFDSIFAWFYTMSDAAFYTYYPRFNHEVFYHNAVIHLCAKSLGCDLLTTETQSRLDFCLQKQIHTNDIERVYRDENLKEFRGMVASNIAETIVKGEVKAVARIHGLKRELMGGVFGRELDAKIQEIREEKTEQKEQKK